MTDSHSRPGVRRRSLTALPLLLVPLLMTACASPAGSPSPSSSGGSGGSGATPSAASAGTSAAGADLYKRYPTSKQFCALVPLADVSAAMQVKPAYPAPKLSSTPVECTYAGASVSSIVSVEWSPAGAGALDDLLEISPKKKKPAAIDVGGHAGRVLSGDVQVVVGDAAIDVFGVRPNTGREAALAAAFLQKVG